MHEKTIDTHPVEQSTTTEGLPLTTGLGPVLESANLYPHSALVDRRVVLITAVSIAIAFASGIIAQVLVRLIGLITNISFYGRLSTDFTSPAENHLGAWVIVIPVIGGIIVGYMARYGSKAIRGHGIPEAMEQILLNESRIPARVTFLKPLSAAISIGTGGPFGAEGPIIATGGALGSLVGQLMKTTASERKVLLAAGAAAGMTATFGSPVSAVLLAVELLLFEFRPRSLIPVALASATAAGVRLTLVGSQPIFAMPDLIQVSGSAIAFYVLLGALVGIASIYVTKLVYWIEDAFEELPVHWMWWPALGGIAVGVVGYFSPHTLGVGYDNIENIVSGTLTGKVMLIFCVMKLISWSISLGSGTSGGTLAPLFTMGGGLGAAIAIVAGYFLPHQGIDIRVAALVGMASIFAGASRAVLASAVFAFETTHQPIGLLPLLGGCTASYLISCLGMKNTIMTEKIVRRGVRVPAEYSADFLDQVFVRDYCSDGLVSWQADDTVAQVREQIQAQPGKYRHQGYPVLDATGRVMGVITRKDFLSPDVAGEKRLRELLRRRAITVYEDSSLREAADLMTQGNIGRLPVVSREKPDRPFAILSRSDILAAHQQRLKESWVAERSIRMGTKSN